MLTARYLISRETLIRCYCSPAFIRLPKDSYDVMQPKRG